MLCHTKNTAHLCLVNNRSSEDEPPFGDDGTGREDDERPRPGLVLLAALLVPAVGAAGSAAGSVLGAAKSASGWILLASVIAASAAVFTLVSLGVIWVLNRVSELIGRAREGRGPRSGDPE